MASGIGGRMRVLRGKESRHEFSRRFNTSVATLARYEADQTSPTADLIKAICEAYDVSPEWLIFGNNHKELQSPKIKGEEEKINRVFIPLKGTELSAGPGSFIDSTETIDMIPVDPKALQYKGNLSELVFMKVGGDSMEPGIYDGDLVLINLARKTVFPNRVYAVAFEGAVHVKRLISEPGRLIMRSNNGLYQDIIIDTKDEAAMSQFAIIGQVTWWMHLEEGYELHIPILSPLSEEPPFKPPRR